MNFPQTRQTLIERIALQGDERSWSEFMADYWGPVCRFARRRGSMSAADAEDVAGQTFLVLVQNRLLARWVERRSAKLRTLLCGVVLNVLANQVRIQKGREHLLRDNQDHLGDRPGLPIVTSLDASADQEDAFYAAWVEELLQRAIEAVQAEYHQAARGDHFRVLYGRLCDGLTSAAIAQTLGLTLTQAENAYKDAHKRLGRQMERLVRDHVERYCAGQEEEFASEWAQLGDFLRRNGGLEQAVQGAHVRAGQIQEKKQRASAIRETLSQMFGGRDSTL